MRQNGGEERKEEAAVIAGAPAGAAAIATACTSSLCSGEMAALLPWSPGAGCSLPSSSENAAAADDTFFNRQVERLSGIRDLLGLGWHFGPPLPFRTTS